MVTELFYQYYTDFIDSMEHFCIFLYDAPQSSLDSEFHLDPLTNRISGILDWDCSGLQTLGT